MAAEVDEPQHACGPGRHLRRRQRRHAGVVEHTACGAQSTAMLLIDVESVAFFCLHTARAFESQSGVTSTASVRSSDLTAISGRSDKVTVAPAHHDSHHPWCLCW